MITAMVLSPAVDKIYFVKDFKAGHLYRVKDVIKSAGGKGINVARVLSILGGDVTAIGFKAGETGEWLDAELKDLGVCTEFIGVEGESRTNCNIIDKLNHTETEILEAGPHITQEGIRGFLDKYITILENTNVLICSGGLPEGIPNDFYKSLIEVANSCGVKVILDSSNEMLEEGIKAAPYIIKPNLRELSKYAGEDLKNTAEIIEACKNILSEGVKIVVASLGSEGALLVSEDMVLSASNSEVDVINSIGSGDSMVAGLALGLSKGLEVKDMFRLGMACAVANTQFMGIGVVSKELVERYSKAIVIEKNSF